MSSQTPPTDSSPPLFSGEIPLTNDRMLKYFVKANELGRFYFQEEKAGSSDPFSDMDGARDLIGRFLIKLVKAYDLADDDIVRVQGRLTLAARIVIDKNKPKAITEASALEHAPKRRGKKGKGKDEDTDFPPEEPPVETVDVETQTIIDKQAVEILSSDDPLKGIKELLDKVIVGEDSNKVLMFLLFLSGKYAKLDKKAAQIIVAMGEAGVGKSNLASISKIFNTKEVGRFTEHALDYSDISSYDILYMKELGFAEEEGKGTASLKFLSSEDQGYIVEYTVRDESGEFTTKQKKIPPITILTTTTRVMLDSQFERRAWFINPDDSQDQSKRILAFKAEMSLQKDEVALGLRTLTDYDYAILVLKAVLAKIDIKYTAVPFANALSMILNSTILRVRGDYDKILALVKFTALILQKRLPIEENTGVIFATPSVLIRAIEIAMEPLISMTLQMDKRTRKILEALDKHGVNKMDQEVGKDLRLVIAKEFNIAERTIRRYMDSLETKGYVARNDEAGRGMAVAHRLLYPLSEIYLRTSALGADLTATTSSGNGGLDKRSDTPIVRPIQLKILFSEAISGSSRMVGQFRFPRHLPQSDLTRFTDQLKNCLNMDGAPFDIKVETTEAGDFRLILPPEPPELELGLGTVKGEEERGSADAQSHLETYHGNANCPTPSAEMNGGSDRLDNRGIQPIVQPTASTGKLDDEAETPPEEEDYAKLTICRACLIEQHLDNSGYVSLNETGKCELCGMTGDLYQARRRSD